MTSSDVRCTQNGSEASALQRWLCERGLCAYERALGEQRVCSVAALAALQWEDLSALGVRKLGHLKRFELELRRLRRRIARGIPVEPEPEFDAQPAGVTPAAGDQQNLIDRSVDSVTRCSPSKCILLY